MAARFTRSQSRPAASALGPRVARGREPHIGRRGGQHRRVALDHDLVAGAAGQHGLAVSCPAATASRCPGRQMLMPSGCAATAARPKRIRLTLSRCAACGRRLDLPGAPGDVADARRPRGPAVPPSATGARRRRRARPAPLRHDGRAMSKGRFTERRAAAGEQRVGLALPGGEAQHRDRPGIEARRGSPSGKGMTVTAGPPRRRPAGTAREGAEADGDLPVEGVGHRQAAVEVAAQHHGVGRGVGQLGDPGLAVVRVGREHRPGQGADARVRVRGGGRCAPRPMGRGGGRARRAPSGRGRATVKAMPAAPAACRRKRRESGIGGLMLFDVELYSSTSNIMQARIDAAARRRSAVRAVQEGARLGDCLRQPAAADQHAVGQPGQQPRRAGASSSTKTPLSSARRISRPKAWRSRWRAIAVVVVLGPPARQMQCAVRGAGWSGAARAPGRRPAGAARGRARPRRRASRRCRAGRHAPRRGRHRPAWRCPSRRRAGRRAGCPLPRAAGRCAHARRAAGGSR